MRLRHNLVLQSVTTERDSLKDSNVVLNSRVDNLRQEKKRVLAYEQKVKDRLGELTAVLETASELGVVPEDELNKVGTTNSNNGVGGAELDCGPMNDNCKASGGAPMFSFSRWFSVKPEDQHGKDND